MGPKIEGAARFAGGGGTRRDHRRRAPGRPRCAAHDGTWIVPDDDGPSRLRAGAGGGVSWQVRTLPDRYADSVRLMGIARGAARAATA